MGLLSHKISRDDLKVGDHIYSWRTAFYAHHGIYRGDGKVIHFTGARGLETGNETFLDKMFLNLIPNPHKHYCHTCGNQSKVEGVIGSCLDCFLAGEKLYLYDYGVSPVVLMAKFRGGTCTTATADAVEQVKIRTGFLLVLNGFGVYHPFKNNCKDFAIYCKTSLVVDKKYVLGRSGRDSTMSGGAFISHMVGIKAIHLVSNVRRLFTDIGMRKGVSKVPYEDYVAMVKARNG